MDRESYLDYCRVFGKNYADNYCRALGVNVEQFQTASGGSGEKMNKHAFLGTVKSFDKDGNFLATIVPMCDFTAASSDEAKIVLTRMAAAVADAPLTGLSYHANRLECIASISV